MIIKKIVSVMQPTVFPWIGYFAMIMKSNVFVFYNDVQFTKQSWQSRNKIKQRNNDIIWLSIPTKKKKLDTLIMDVAINNDLNWIGKHLKTYENLYSKCKYYHWFYPHLESHYLRNYDKLVDFNIDFIEMVCNLLNINTLFLKSEDLSILNSDKNLKLAEMVTSLNGEIYLSPNGAKGYIDENIFENNGIEVHFLDYEHPVYDQFGNDFTPYLSIIDLLFNCGPHALKIIENSLDLRRKNECLD